MIDEIENPCPEGIDGEFVDAEDVPIEPPEGYTFDPVLRNFVKDHSEKGTDEALNNIADHWNQLGDDEKNGIVDALAGIKEVTDDAEN